ncbi:unnamed protein product [Orchesella dallaii]|uniref:SET domain-containing protein n=1 Tax=Orchesella dallaii TaxID=48710 RepID=A0ABP1QCE8_9HEXA
MSLMNYLGAVASAAVEAASASSVKGPVVASATGASTSNVNISDGSTIVSTTASVGNPDNSSRTIPQGLPSFPVVPITIHHSSGPSGQFTTYAVQTISNGAVRLGSPHGSSAGPGQRPTYTVHSLAGQIPTHFSFASGGSSQPSVGFRMQSPSSSTISQVPTPVGSHIIDKQRNLFQVPFRGSSIPPSISQPSRPVEQEIRREPPPEPFRQKPQVPNLNTSRPSVLMGPRNNVPNVPHDFFPRNPALALSIVLQDHNYTLPKPSPTTTPAANFHAPQEVLTPALPVSHRPPSPCSKIHPPAVQINPKPSALYGNVRGSSPPAVSKSVRPRSTSPLNVPGRRRRKTFERKEKEFDDFSRKVGVPGRKRTRRQTDLPVSNNPIPPLANDVPDPDSNTNTSMVKTNSSIPFIESEPITRRLKKHRDEVPQLNRKNKEKVVEAEKSVELDEIAEESNSKDEDNSYPEVVEEQAKEKEEISTSTLNTSSQEDSNNEGITRCICDYLHDDGFMICCDKCLMWQHVDCMGIDRTDIPENYLCELCKPRWVSKTRARAIQTRKKEMLEIGVLDDTRLSRVAENQQDEDAILERSPISRSNSLELTVSPHTHTLSPTKSSGKLKRRGRPSLSNGQPFSDSDSEIHSGLHSPVAKRSRKYSGKRGQNLNVLDDSPSKIGTRKQRSLEPRVKRGYTRRNTLSSPLSSPSSEDIKSVEDHKEDSTSCPDISDLLVQYNSVSERAGSDSDDRVSSINAPAEDASRNEEIYSKGGSNDANGTFSNIESRRKRKQIFKDIPNGDLSPPHIISSTSPLAASDKQTALKPRSPSFDKTISNTNSLTSSPEPPSNPVSSLHVNVSGFNSTSLCLYSSSPYLDKYEEAINSVCSYSPELRAKLLKNHGMMGNSSVPEPEFTPLSESVKKWKLGVTSLEGGKKLRTLLAAVRVEPGEAIIEYIGKFLMLTGFQPTSKRSSQGNPNMISPEPFVFFHQVPKNGMCICIDCRKYGNDARFVRRSCTPNAEIRHVVGKGTIHAYVVATEIVDLDEEVTIPHEYKSVTCNTMNSIVQKYHVMSPPLPCACSDLDTCKAVAIESVVGDVVHKKNGALISPTALPHENKERRRRMSSRRTSSLDKEAAESLRTPLASPSPQQQQQQQQLQQQMAIVSPSDSNKSLISSPSPVEEIQESPSVVPISKERTDGRTTRARTIAVAVSAEEASTPVSKRKVVETPLPPRQRNRSGADATTPTSGGEIHAAESHKMTREERKLQSVLKIIEKLESNQKKKESRQNQKKDKGGKSKKIEDRETDHDDDLPVQATTPTSAALAPIKFAPTIKKKGRKRGRSTSKSSGKPQLISHRNSGSIADLRSTSTESDINSADEASRAGMSPLQENMGPNFRLPKKKEMMSEWRIGGGHPSPSLPSQYMRKSNTAIVNHPGVSSAAVLPSTSSGLTTPSNNFLSVPAPNGPLDNASAKKRWLRQAISEETDPAAAPVPNSNSRPDSPTGVECLAPLKKRRLARASMSSEVSNTPPSTPNNVDAAYCEVDADGENEPETEQHNDVTETEEPEVEATVREVPARKWSCSEVSSAEEDMEDLEDTKNDETSAAEVESKVVEDPMTPEPAKKTDSENDTSDSLNRSPRCTAGRRSRWDQVDAPEPVVNSSISSPVKSTDAIVLDYVRNPEQYAKLTGVAAFDSEKGACTYDKDQVQVEPNTTESNQAEVTTLLVPETPKTGTSTPKSRSTLLNPKVSSRNDKDSNLYSNDADSIKPTHRIASEHAKSSPRTQTQVKKKLSMEEYLKRKMEGKSTDDRATALNQPSTALNAMVNSDSNSSEPFVLNVKDLSSPKPDDDPKIRGTLQFSSTPTLAERKREELGKRLYSFGIRVPDAESANVESIPAEKQPAQSVSLTTPTYTASPREVVSVEKPKSNGDITISYGRTGSTPSLTPANIPTSVGHRLSVPTPAALKQSGMPPLPSHLSSSPMHSNSVTVSTPNGASKPIMNSTPNGYSSNTGMPQCGASYRHYRGSSSNGPSNYNHHQQNRSMLTSGPSNSSAVNSSTSGPIIGGVPVGNLIPPPPPPTSQGTAGPAFGNRFQMKKFFHSS